MSYRTVGCVCGSCDGRISDIFGVIGGVGGGASNWGVGRGGVGQSKCVKAYGCPYADSL
jgi:hypothetical protein